MKKPARDFLPGTDLGKRAVTLGVEIDLEGFLAGVQFVRAHILVRRKIHKIRCVSNKMRFDFPRRELVL